MQRITLLKKKVMANTSSSWSKGWKRHSGWKNKITRWRQLKFGRTMDQRRPEGDEMERGCNKCLYEAGLQMKDKKASWQKGLKESLKREAELVQQTAEL